MFRVLATLLTTATLAHGINWNGNWANSCHFIGNDLTNSLSTGKDCAGPCASTKGCTHYTWTNYNGGTCWMKKNSVSKSDAVPKYDQGAVCGVIVVSVDSAIAGVVTGVVNGVVTDTVGGVAVGGVAVGGVVTGTVGGVVTGTLGGVAAGGEVTGTLGGVAAGGEVTGTVGGGGVTGTLGGEVTGNKSEVISTGINWHGSNWAASCHFIGNDLANALTRSKDCGRLCASTPGCTHFTWTNYNGGTCWMKKNSVSKSNAVPRYDQGAVCGVVNDAVSGATLGINWHGKNWAASCQFIGNDLANALTRSKDCGRLCVSTPDCTHFTWTNYNGGTCWMKKNSVSKSNAVPKYDQGAVCGVAVKSVSGVDTGSVGASENNWNGNNWAASCAFVDNVLTNILTRAEHCAGRCMSTPGCTHHFWTNYNGRICWTNRNSDDQSVFTDYFRRPYHNQIIINLD